MLVRRASLRSCLRWAPATLPVERGFPTSARALSCDTDNSFSAAHLSEMGAAERITAPTTVAPIISNFRIAVLLPMTKDSGRFEPRWVNWSFDKDQTGPDAADSVGDGWFGSR